MSIAYSIVDTFEREIAEWAGAKYGVAVSSCCNAIFLCLKYLDLPTYSIQIPNRTYPGVAMAINNAGYKIMFNPRSWQGHYCLFPYSIVDGALRFKRNMLAGNFHCLSFHYKKHLPIGRGGMILTDDEKAYNWLKKARWDGRTEGVPLDKDNATICGWNMYMTPEQAARGLTLFELIKDKDLPDLKVEEQNYPDLSTWKCFR